MNGTVSLSQQNILAGTARNLTEATSRSDLAERNYEDPMTRPRDYRGPGRQPPGRPGRRSGRPRKEGPIQAAVKLAVNEEIKGVPSAEILLHLRSAGLDTETARMVYGHVREEVAKTRRRAMWGLMVGGAVLLATSLGLLLAMTIRWPGTGYVWWILVSLLAVIGLALVVIGQARLRGMQEPKTDGTGKDRAPGRRR